MDLMWSVRGEPKMEDRATHNRNGGQGCIARGTAQEFIWGHRSFLKCGLGWLSSGTDWKLSTPPVAEHYVFKDTGLD